MSADPRSPGTEAVDVEVMLDSLTVANIDEDSTGFWLEVIDLASMGSLSVDHLMAIIDKFHQLFETHGEPLTFGEDRNGYIMLKGINEGFFAGLCSAKWLVIHEPDEGRFYRYNSLTGIYEVCSADWGKQAVSEIMLKASRKSPTLEKLSKMRSDKILTAVVSQMRGVAEKRGAFDSRGARIHLSNCVLRLAEGGISREDFSPENYARRRSCVIYDPSAVCPRFIGELLEPALDPDDQLLLQKMAGQFLLGVNLVQRLVSMIGEGGRGKTTLANVIQGIVGEDVVGQLRTKTLGERFEIGRYAGCSLLMGVDVGPHFLTGESAEAVKGLIGGDRFVSERKNSNKTIPVKGNFNLLVTSNPRLKVAVKDDASAWHRRLLCIEFYSEGPVKKIPGFAEKLIADEGPGILNWMLDGLQMLRSDIEELGDVRMTPAQVARIDAMVGYGDSVRLFLSERVCARGGSDLSAAELADAYERFCQQKGCCPMTKTQVVRQLPDLMLAMGASRRHDIIRNGGMVRGYGGVSWLEAEKQCPGGSR